MPVLKMAGYRTWGQENTAGSGSICVSLSPMHLSEADKQSLPCHLGAYSGLGKHYCPWVVFMEELDPSYLSQLTRFLREMTETNAQRLWKRIPECEGGRLDPTDKGKAAVEDPTQLRS